MTMKSANIAELKANLSKYVKLVKKGQRVVVMERNTPVAELIPYKPSVEEVFAQLVAEGKCKPPTRKPGSVVFTPLDPPMTTAEVDALCKAVNGDE